jgi:hypothetical protein
MAQNADVGPATAELEIALIEQQLDSLEGAVTASRPGWPWLLVVVGFVAVLGLGAHGYFAFASIDRIDASSKIVTPNPIVLFQDLATNGPRVPANVEASSRNTYSRALSQFILDGTGVCLGLVLAIAGLFVRANQ